jgi:hypothetical protein
MVDGQAQSLLSLCRWVGGVDLRVVVVVAVVVAVAVLLYQPVRDELLVSIILNYSQLLELSTILHCPQLPESLSITRAASPNPCSRSGPQWRQRWTGRIETSSKRRTPETRRWIR